MPAFGGDGSSSGARAVRSALCSIIGGGPDPTCALSPCAPCRCSSAASARSRDLNAAGLRATCRRRKSARARLRIAGDNVGEESSLQSASRTAGSRAITAHGPRPALRSVATGRRPSHPGTATGASASWAYTGLKRKPVAAKPSSARVSRHAAAASMSEERIADSSFRVI
eukprot:scaffold163956_cov27-Tisochrysis_lutea.AAC.5